MMVIITINVVIVFKTKSTYGVCRKWKTSPQVDKLKRYLSVMMNNIMFEHFKIQSFLQ